MMTAQDNTAAISDVSLLTAGHAVFTISNPDGEYYTYSLSHNRFAYLKYASEEAAREDLAKFKGGTYTGTDSYDRSLHVLKVGVRDWQDTGAKTELHPVKVHAPLYVSVKRGPEAGDMAYLGMWENDKLRFTKQSSFRPAAQFEGEWVNDVDWAMVCRINKAAKASDGTIKAVAKSIAIIVWIFHALAKSGTLPEGYEIRHRGCCMRCGRPLDVPISIDRGLGPVCFEKLFG
jgi:hypothetical protein